MRTPINIKKNPLNTWPILMNLRNLEKKPIKVFIAIELKRKGIAKPKEYKHKSIIPLIAVSRVAEKISIEERIGPIQGDHPRANAQPTKNALKYFHLIFLGLKIFSSFSKKFNFKIPIRYKPKSITTPPPIFLKKTMYLINNLDKKINGTPNIIKIKLNPKTKKTELINAINLFLPDVFTFCISSKEIPAI